MGELVSVIIPAYNVEKYLNQCIESVVNQTYKNIEIIIVYDESKDDTLRICKEWKERDNRIFLIISSKRCGLGAARNLGLLNAKGEYITYVDSDDWLKTELIEKLYTEISSTGADYVSSRGYFEVTGDEIAINHAIPSGRYDDNELKEGLFISDNVCVWKKIYRKKWLDENELINPPLFYYEDWGMFPTIMRQAKKVSVIDEAGVYYRRFREGCLTNDFVSAGMLQAFEKALRYILDYLDAHNLKRKEDSNLAYYSIKDYYYRLKFAKKLANMEALQSLKNIKNNVLIKEFGEFDFEKYHYVALGSFSLRWEIHKAVFHSEYLSKHYCFSSIISVMSKCLPVRLEHENKFRQEQAVADISSELLDEIQGMGNNGVLFIDFLEERYDLLEIDDCKYITLSDAFLESTKDEGLHFKRVIKWESDEYMILWKKSCLDFINYLKKYIDKSQVIYVANRMSLYYGDFNEMKQYSQWERISRINARLSEMERFFFDNFQGIKIVQPGNKAVFTDKNFRLGCEPYYMNNVYYSMTGVEIFSKLMKWGC